MAESPPLLFTRLGRTYGGWRVLDRIGTGGMGEVFRARHETLASEAALKFIGLAHIGDEVNRKRFLREIRACSALSHPSIIRILGAGEEKGDIYLAMDLLEGDNLAWRLDVKGPLDVPRALDLGADMLEALAYMHPLGFVHRDIKPSNIFLTTDGRHVLMDFGLVRVEGEGTLTIAGNVLGTPRYMSPEAMAGAISDRRGDLYQVGLVIYEALARQMPYTSADHTCFARGEYTPRPLPVRHWREDVPHAVEVMLANAVAADPRERYACAEAMLEDLRRAAAGRDVERLGSRARARPAVVLPAELAKAFPGAELLEEEPGLSRWFHAGAAGQRPAVLKVLAASLCGGARGAELAKALQALTGIAHPPLHVPRQVARAGAPIYLVEDLPRGETLSRVKPALPVDEGVALGVALCDALAPLHATGRPHGFVDPRTVRVEGGSLACLTDLELLILHQIGNLAEAKDSTLKFSGYTAPEQLDGHPPTASADVFSVGQLLTGLIGARADAATQSVLKRATAPVSQRYPSVAALRSALTGGGKLARARSAESSPGGMPVVTAPPAPRRAASDAPTEKLATDALSAAPVRPEPPPVRPDPPPVRPDPPPVRPDPPPVRRDPAAAATQPLTAPPPPTAARASAAGRIAGRPLPAAALTALLVIGLIAAVRPRGADRAALEPVGLNVERSPAEVTLVFDTRAASNPAVEVGPVGGPLRLVREAGPPRTRHRFPLRALVPGARYALRFVYPDGTRSPTREIATAPVSLARGAERYDVLRVELEFTSEPPVRCRVDAVPSSRATTAAALPVLVEERESATHAVQVPLVVPGEPCTLKVALIRSEGEPVPLVEWPVVGLAERLDALERGLAPLKPEALIAQMVKLRGATPPDRQASDVARAVARVRPALERLIGFLPNVLAHRAVGLVDKLTLYRIATPLLHLDAACDTLGVPFESGVTRALPPAFRCARTAPGKPAKKILVRLPGKNEPFVPQATPLALVEEGLPQNSLFKGEAGARFALTGAASYARAAVHVPVVSFNPQHMPELFFEVSLNQQVPLVCRYDAQGARAAPPRPGLWHAFDPRLLAEGRNEVVVRLKQTPGMAAPLGQVPLGRIEIWLWKGE